MKIYIMTDLEGVAGVINWTDYGSPGARYYERACELTTRETNAAIEGALEAGAREFLVVDGHGHGAINPLLLHPAAKLLAGRPVTYPFGCDASFDAAFIIGQHAKSNTDGGHLCHTGSFAVEEMTINGVSVGELACNMLMCAYYKVPTILVAGDFACAEEAKALVPSIETAVVKWGLRNGSASGLSTDENLRLNGAAVHLHPEAARKVIFAAARRAVERCKEIEPFWINPPYELVCSLRHTEDQPRRRAVVQGDDLIKVLNSPKQFQPFGE